MEISNRHFILLIGFVAVCCLHEVVSEDAEPPDIFFTVKPKAEIQFSNNTGGSVACKASGTTPTSVSWIFTDGTPVSNITHLRQLSSDGTLTFLPFNSEAFRQDVHSVVYKCQATNAAGRIISRDVRVKAVMDVDYDSSVYDVFAIRGNTAVIKCHVPAFLQDFVSVVAFIRDDSLKISTKVDTDGKYSLASHGSLYIRDVGTSDAGTTYKCQTYHHLTGKIKISTSSGKLFVTEPHGNIPPRIVDSIPSIRVKLGENVLLPCIAHGYPAPTSSWFIKTETQMLKVNFDMKRIRVSSHGLMVSNVKVSDSGVYVCQIENTIGTDEAQISLTVNAPLQVSVVPRRQRVDLGHPFSLKCNISGYPVQSISWTMNGFPITSPRIRTVDKFQIQVDAITLEDKGVYQCFVQNENEVTEGTAQVILGEFPPMFRDTFKEEVLQPGSSVVLTCQAIGNPSPKMEWTLDMEPIRTDARISIEEKQLPDTQIISILNIHKLVAEDGGVYSCKASNNLAEAVHSAKMNIYDDIQLPDNLRQSLTANWTLFIDEVQRKEDSGEYLCTASNIQGQSVTASIQVAVLVLPKITPFAFQDELLREGMRARIQCVVSEGDSPVTITWKKDNQLLKKNFEGLTLQDLDEFSSILAIRTITPKHNGNYSCVASNLAGSTSYTASLFVNAPPKIIPFAFQDDQNFKGMRAHITCAVSQGDLPLTFQWLKDGQEIPKQLGATIGGYDRHSSSLSTENVLSKHSGNYTCVVTNEAGRASFTAQLMVQVAPKIVPFTFQGDHLFEGVLARVTCVVYQGDLPLSIIWKKDGEPINSLDGVTIHTVDDFTSILTIDHVQKKHSGNYSCIAKNSAEAFTHTAQLIVKVPPKIVPFSFHDEDLVEGMFVRVSCIVSRGDLPLSITWTKDKQPIPTSLNVLTRQTDDYSSVLSIDHVTVKHTGNYTCTATNLAATANLTSSLLVYVPPQWTVSPEAEVEALAGTEIAMHCQADGFPKPTIVWMTRKDSSRTSPTEPLLHDDNLQILTNGTLLIKNIEPKHQRFYFCKATNGIGKGLSKLTRLTVQVPPTITNKSETQIVKKGEKLTISCTVSADKPINSSWFVNGKPLSTVNNKRFSGKQEENAKDTSTKLTISKIIESDAANFTCQLENKHGIAKDTISVIVQGPPGTPQGIKINPKVDRSVEVAWQAPDHGHSPITKYIISYWTIKQGKIMNYTTTSTTTQVVLNDLQPSSIYKLTIFAENAIGRSETGGKAEIKLDGEAPSGEPMQVQVQAQNGKSLRVSWQPPPIHTWNGNIQGYYVGYRITETHDPFEYRLLEVPAGYSKGLSYTISDLKEFTSYSIVVQAFNEHGKGPMSLETLAMTSEGIPNKAPLAVSCTPTSSQTITIHWQSPPQTSIQGILRGYRIFYWTPDIVDDETMLMIVNTSETKITLRGLYKYANYSIQVLAYTLVGDGVPSKSIFCQTLEDTPSSPKDIKAIPSSTTSILITWLPPTYPNGVIHFYTIYVEEAGPEMKEASHAVKDYLTTTHEIHNLQKSKEYKFRVSASTSVGEGPSSQQISSSPAGPTLPAKIAAFSQMLRHPVNTPLTLPCPVVGMPTPKRNWSFRNQLITSNNRISIQSDGALKLSTLHVADAGNFTCRTVNQLGQDEVTYTVIVKARPLAPTLIVSSSAFTTIDLQWKPPTTGHTSILGYTLHYKQELGVWQSIELKPYQNAFQIGNLQCGTNYQMYLVAFNEVGNGQPSETITVTTTGGAPSIPPASKLIEENSAHVVLHLDAWTINGCPILYFVVEYKQRASKSWSLVSNNLLPERQSLILDTLNPDTRYTVRMTAHTTAGSAVAEYDFSTLRMDSVLGDEDGIRKSKSFFGFLNVKVLISISICVVIVLLCFAITCFWVSRQRNAKKTSKSKSGKRTKRAKRSNRDSKVKSDVIDDDEISPYAMVKLSDFQQEPRRPSDHKQPSSSSGTPLKQFASHNYNPTAPPMSESYSPFAKGIAGAAADHPRKYPALPGHPIYAMPVKKEMMKALREAPMEGMAGNDPDLIPPPPEETIFVFPAPPPNSDEPDGDYDPPPPEIDWLPRNN